MRGLAAILLWDGQGEIAVNEPHVQPYLQKVASQVGVSVEEMKEMIQDRMGAKDPAQRTLDSRAEKALSLLRR